MKILFDQNVPRPLAGFLVGHTVVRSAERGWSELRNGDLLRVAEQQGFQVMVTADQNLAYQQNLTGRHLALVILPSVQWPKVEKRLAEAIRAVDEAQPGSFTQLLPVPSRRTPRLPLT